MLGLHKSIYTDKTLKQSSNDNSKMRRTDICGVVVEHAQNFSIQKRTSTKIKRNPWMFSNKWRISTWKFFRHIKFTVSSHKSLFTLKMLSAIFLLYWFSYRVYTIKKEEYCRFVHHRRCWHRSNENFWAEAMSQTWHSTSETLQIIMSENVVKSIEKFRLFLSINWEKLKIF